MLSERIGILSDSIVLTIVLNAAAATKLAMTQRLASLGQLMLNGVSGAIWPSLAEMHSRGEHKAFNVRLIELTRLVVVMGIAGLAPVIAYNPLFIARWVGPALDGGRLVVVVAAAIAILQGLLQASYSHSREHGLRGQARALRVDFRDLEPELERVLHAPARADRSHPGDAVGRCRGADVVLAAPTSPSLRHADSGARSRRGGPDRLRRSLHAGLDRALADSHVPPNWFALLGEMGAFGDRLPRLRLLRDSRPRRPRAPGGPGCLHPCSDDGGRVTLPLLCRVQHSTISQAQARTRRWGRDRGFRWPRRNRESEHRGHQELRGADQSALRSLAR